jgi:cell division protease FtsH
MKKRFKKTVSFQGGPRNIIVMLGLLLLGLFVLTKLNEVTYQSKPMSYTAFLKKVEDDEVKAVHVSGQDAYGILKNGTRFETVLPDNVQNWTLLREHDVEVSIQNPSDTWNVSALFAWISMLIALGALGIFLYRQRQSGGGGGNIFSIGRSRAKMSMPSTVKIKFDDVAGAKEAKQELKDVVDYLKDPDKYKRLGAKITRGVLLVGEPGNGKTLLAKAVAGEANVPFFSITGSDFIEVFVGVGAARVRDLFAQARKTAPSIVFIDEIDAIGRQRGSGFGGGHDEREQTLNQLLTEMDGFDTSGAPVIVLAATNMPDVLDKALLRPGRFDRRVNVPFPDEESRHQILLVHAHSIAMDPEVNLTAIATDTAGFSGADLANLVNIAAINASKKNKPLVTQEDFDEALKSIIQSHATGGMRSSAEKSQYAPKMFMPSQVKVNFDQVAGADEAKEELVDVVDFLKNPQKFNRLGAKLPRGVLLAGEPGNGKTLLAKAVAGEANVPFFSASGSEFVEKYVGVGAARVRELFSTARRHAPAIIFIDEIDAVGRSRGGSEGGHEEREQTLNQILTEMDGFDTSAKPVIVIGATNRPDILDKALLRPGRFDKKVEVPYPDLLSRKKILLVHAKDKKIDPSVNFDTIAKGTPGFTGADLANLINEAAILASKSGKDQVLVEDFEEARDKILLGKESKTKILTPKEREVTAFHEAGHALVRLLLPEHSDPLYKVTIVPRGRALGVTHSLPEKEKYTADKEEMMATIASALGGRVAEELVFNKLETGAASDFQKATEIARDMVCRYGMSEKLGPIFYGQSPRDYRYSESTSQLIDDEVRSLTNQSYIRALDLLKTNRDKLDALANALLEKETLYAGEIYELLSIAPREEFKLS